MKKLFPLTFLIIPLFPLIVMSQSCFPDGITFINQVEIDEFLIKYPDCIEIEGDLVINSGEEGSITNLDGLRLITAIGGFLNIESNNDLSNLTGLDNLISIGEGLNFESNGALLNLVGLANLESIGGNLSIANNISLSSLDGLLKLTSIGGDIEIEENNLIDNLAGLQNIDPNTISGVFIIGNPNLSICEAQSICDYLAIPEADVEFQNNAAGCNSKEEVEGSCSSFIEDLNTGNAIHVYPNPFSISIILEYELNQAEQVTLEINNYMGQRVAIIQQKQPAGKQQIVWDAKGLPGGMYFYRIQAGEQIISGKIVKQR